MDILVVTHSDKSRRWLGGANYAAVSSFAATI